jgi:peroxiredoxin
MSKKKKISKSSAGKTASKRKSTKAKVDITTPAENVRQETPPVPTNKTGKLGILWEKHPVLLAISGLCIVALIVGGVIVHWNSVQDKSVSSLNTSNVEAPPSPAPVNEIEITNFTVTNITENSLTVTWKTNVPATTELLAEDQKVSTSVASWPDNNLVLEHKVVLESLQPSTAYILRIKSKDASGNQATIDVDMPYETLSPRYATGMTIGEAGPDFMLKDINGKSISLSDFKGKWVMLAFWMTSCSGCREELPRLNEFWINSKSEKIALLTVNVAGQEAVTRSYVASQKLTFPVLLDQEKEAYEKYSVAKFPTTFLIDPDGMVNKITEEAFKNEADIESFVRSALKTD